MSNRTPDMPRILCAKLLWEYPPHIVMARELVRLGLVLLLAGRLIVAQQHCGANLSPLLDGEVEQRLRHLASVHARGAEAIPMLLAEIGNTETAPVNLENPFLSNRPFSSPRPCGLVAAYLIELILGRSSLELHAITERAGGTFLVEGGPANYVYGLGYIVEIASDRPIDGRTIRKISEVYRRWWSINSGRTLPNLRDDWTHGRTPLSGTGYKWR